MTIGAPFLIATLGMISIFLIAFSLVPTENVLKTRLQKLERINEKSLAERSVVIDQIISEESKSTLRQRLNEGGWYNITPVGFTMRSLGAAGIGICLGATFVLLLHASTFSFIGAALVALTAWRMPSIMLSRAIKERKESIGRALPDYLDLMATTVSAGLALNPAMIHGVDVVEGALREEMASTLSEIRLGRSRIDALNSLSKRVNEASLSKMITALANAERLGSNISDVVQELSKDLRDARWMRAEEKAAQLHIKMILPMTVFMIPALYLMIFGPMIAQMVEPK